MERSRRPQISDILAVVDLATLLDELATPARGRRWHCPITGHDDEHPSVTMYTDSHGHQRWRCWSGADDHRGDALDLVVAVHNLSPGDAIDWLAERIGPTPTPAPPAATPNLGPGEFTGGARPGGRHLRAALAQLLWTDHGARYAAWLYRRGLYDDVLRVNQIGADPGRRVLPRRRGLPAGDGPAATFPALDTTGAVFYVQTRYLKPRPGQPKYDNPAARLGTNPRLAWLRPPVPRHEHDLVICEGIPDALTAAQAGYRAVATLGTHAADPDVARALAEHAASHGLMLTAVVDADPPGRAAGKRLATLLAGHNVTLRIVEPANGLDLNDWAQRDPSWPSRLTPANPTVSRPRALVRHELLTALRFRAAHTARPAPTDQHGPMIIADNERQISRLEAELDQLDGHPPAHTTHPTVNPDPGIEI